MKNSPSSQILNKFITVQNIKLHYLEAGEGDVVLMLHGFPTAAYLWRNIMPKISETHRVIALDLPGYGKSEKPLSVSYSSNFYTKLLSDFLEQLKITSVNLVVHDLGGPIGLHWAVRHKEMVKSLVLFNTLVYPKFSWAVIAFTLAIKMPFIRNWISSPNGIKKGLRIGVQNKDRITGELLQNYQEPFLEKEPRLALQKSASNISIKALQEIEKKLPTFTIPVAAIYGINDRILPHVAKTMERVKKDLPQAVVTPIPNCGHFLQEDEPEIVSKILSNFYNATN